MCNSPKRDWPGSILFLFSFCCYFVGRTVFWGAAGTGAVEMFNLDACERILLQQISLSSPAGLAVSADSLFVSARWPL